MNAIPVHTWIPNWVVYMVFMIFSRKLEEGGWLMKIYIQWRPSVFNARWTILSQYAPGRQIYLKRLAILRHEL